MLHTETRDAGTAAVLEDVSPAVPFHEKAATNESHHCGTTDEATPTTFNLSPWPDAWKIDCYKTSVVRPVDWRWQLALYCVQLCRRRVPRSYAGDETLCRAFRFVRAVTRGRDPRSIDPDLAAARMFAEKATSIERAHVEARIIAGLADEQIATRTGRPVSVIRLYETVFFAVRDVGPSYLAHALQFHWEPAEGSPDREAWLLRLAGFLFGPEPLEWLLDIGGPSAIESRNPLDEMDERTQRLVRVKAALAIVLWEPKTPRELRRAIRVAHLVRKAEFAAAKARRRSGYQMRDASETRLSFIL